MSTGTKNSRPIAVTERHSLPTLKDFPRSGPAMANDIRMATLRGRSSTYVPLKPLMELQVNEGDQSIRGEPVKTRPFSTLSANPVLYNSTLLALPTFDSILPNRPHSAAATSHPPSSGSIHGKDHPENNACDRESPKCAFDSPKANTLVSTHELALRSYRMARGNPAGNGMDPGFQSTSVRRRAQMIWDDYDRDAGPHSQGTINGGSATQKPYLNTSNCGVNAKNLPLGSSPIRTSYHSGNTTVSSPLRSETLMLDIPHGFTPYTEASQSDTSLLSNLRAKTPLLGLRSAMPSTPFKFKSLLKNPSQFFKISTANSSVATVNSSINGSISSSVNSTFTSPAKVKQPKYSSDVTIVTVQTHAQMFLETARKAEEKGKTVYFAASTGSTFVLTNDSCAGAYNSIKLSTANLQGQIAPRLMGAAELPPAGGNPGKKGLLYLCSPEQIMGLLPFEMVDVEREGRSQMHGLGTKVSLGENLQEHKWKDAEERRFTLTLHLGTVEVRGPGQLVGGIPAVFWA